MSLSDERDVPVLRVGHPGVGGEIQELRSLHPMEAKKRLARTVTAMYHGEAGATDGEAHFYPSSSG